MHLRPTSKLGYLSFKTLLQLMWWYRLMLDLVKTSRQELYTANMASKVALYLN